MKLTIDRNASGFDALRSEWNELLQTSQTNTIFLSWEWQTTWWRHWGTDELYLLSWRDEETGRLVGLAPLFVDVTSAGERRLLLVGGIEVCDYLDVIVAPENAAPVYLSLVEWLDSPGAPAWDLFELVNVPLASPTLTELRARLAARWPTDARKEDVCPIIQLPADWESYLNLLDKHQRHEVRRKLRKIEQAPNVRWWFSASPADLDRDVEDFITLHQLSSADKDDFMTEPMKAFFRDLAQVMAAKGWLALALLEVNGQPAAALFSFRWQEQWLLYNSGYDPLNFKDLSTGVVLQARCIEYAIQAGFRVFDFLQGNEVYKYRLGGQDTEVWRLTVRQPAAV
ncbi:GNAT family N-acetyltransferase [Candidatus Amarolinea aalborgensis]|uniref:GNAT family N-acetyltransferase n=1 Tax=Candidatus Amarolinea aalborgensis TaxID=2249329 RepID=UPI003BF9E9D5